jgi:tetratricopeptide (TPR) repeat protein
MAAPRHWVFGYGSIIQEASRLITLGASGSAHPAAFVELIATAGFVREWSFRAPSGFTALGLRRCGADEAQDVCGVLFGTGDDGALQRFDLREKGYERIAVDPRHLRLVFGAVDSGTAGIVASALDAAAGADGSSRHRFWAYVPLDPQPANEEYPICQTYLDVVISGCLDCGGKAAAVLMVRTTGGWSQYWLNDAPMSRRPWLHRPRHAEVDEVLRAEASHTRFEERRHPEEFSGRWSASLRGLWGVPPRNPHFTGREEELARLAGALAPQGEGMRTLDLVGMGGVGKTQLAIEFCYRQYTAADRSPPAAAGDAGYGLVVWLRAESSEALAADLRSLALDCGIGVQGLRSAEIVAEVRSRLYRTRCAWLLVFDNLNERSLLGLHLPRGAHGLGHVLVTSRDLQPADAASVFVLSCLSPAGSLDLLRRAGGDHLGVDEPAGEADTPAGAAVAEKLGHLPLALALAAAYMRACDVSCGAYLRRLERQSSAAAPMAAGAEQGSALLQGYAQGVAESFELSLSQLDRIEPPPHPVAVRQASAAAQRLAAEAAAARRVSARRVLDVLAFASSDDISKRLACAVVRGIAVADARAPDTREGAGAGVLAVAAGGRRALGVGEVVAWAGSAWAVGGALAAVLVAAAAPRLGGARAAVAAAAIVAAAATASVRFSSLQGAGRLYPTHPFPAPSSTSPAHGSHPLLRQAGVGSAALEAAVDEAVEATADQAWLLLKKFCLLAVRQRTGSIHRLLGQSLRGRMRWADKAHALGVCAWAVEHTWAFDASDSTTWRSATDDIEHVQSLGKHARDLLQSASGAPAPLLSELQLRVASLLTQGAACMSMALSQFERAREALETALSILEHELPLQARDGGRLAACRSAALHTAGQVARYRGGLDEAEAQLERGLAIRRASGDDAGCAASLHELGVVALRRADWAGATRLLRRSLDAQRALGRGSRGEAATLHQLAVAALSSRPARLEEAEGLLREALALEAKGAQGGRAATLQQLARVAERRGDGAAALAHLRDALELHARAYGEGVPHVNKASVLSQLANLAAPAEAPGFLHEALAMRRRIYGRGDHPEIALNLGKLGEAERKRGCLPAARAHFAEQRAMLERLLLPAPEPEPMQALVRMLGSGALVSGRTFAQLLHALRWQRTSAREAGDAAAAAELGAEAQQLQHAMLLQDGEATAQPAPRPAPSSPLLERACACRNAVRAALIELKQQRATDAEGVDATAGVCLGRVASVAETLAGVVGEGVGQGGGSREAEARADSVCGEEEEEEEERTEGAAESRLRAAVLEFVAELRAAAGDQPVNGAAADRLERRLFGACDVLRARLREEGVVLTDVIDDWSRAETIAEQGDYMLSTASLAQLQRAFGAFTVDAFASAATAQLPRFWSSHPEAGGAAVDAFAQEWAGEHLLAHAPVHLLGTVADKLRATPGASAVVVAPHWTGAPWFRQLHELARDSILLPAGSLRAVAARTAHVRSWRAVAFHVARRDG